MKKKIGIALLALGIAAAAHFYAEYKYKQGVMDYHQWLGQNYVCFPLGPSSSDQ